MTTPKLHDEQLVISDATVRALIDSQFPQWAPLPLRRLSTAGTIHRIDLLGEELVVRVPTISWGEKDIAFDADVLPLIAPALPVATPELVARGKPTADAPWEWGVYRRLPGRHPAPGDDADSATLARELPPLIAALRSLPPVGPASAAVFAFADDDARTRPKFAELARWLDPSIARIAWDEALTATPWDGDEVWIHGDLVSGNLLLGDSKGAPLLTGVLDWPASGIGDPAFDLLPAWTGMNSQDRTAFLEAVAGTPDQIARGRGYALRKVAWGLPYYEHTLPSFAAMLVHAARQIAADFAEPAHTA
jgi:aminoglycoside phosphotransferase (APT) family kinase protein